MIPMTDICFGFEAHQPYRLNRRFARDPAVGRGGLMDLYFDEANREFLLRASRRCYTPATRKILDMLDDGFRCSFSFSGTLLEQLERWDPDTFELLSQAARHKGVELLAQPYYHSVAGEFDEKREFKSQLKMHTELIRALFGKQPRICVNTELTLSNSLAGVIRRAGLKGAITEGSSRILNSRTPNEVYICNDLPLLLRNPELSNDIALRFANSSWDRFPLTADKFSGWLADSPGDAVTIYLNYETFGEHLDESTGIFEFLSCLPGECRDRGQEPVLPSEVIENYPAAGSLDIPQPVSWADLENDTSAWLGNDMQKNAFGVLERGEEYAGNSPFWRYLQTIDHFYYMASRYGYAGEPHAYLGHQEQGDAFSTYMRVLSDCEERAVPGMKDREAAWTLRTLPPEQAFSFGSPAGPIGYSAYNLDQFLESLRTVPMDSIVYHQDRGDFELWIRTTLADPALAKSVKKQKGRQEIIETIRERIEELWNRLK
jgi:alpha-amylase